MPRVASCHSFPMHTPVHELSWWSLGRNAVGKANDVEGCGGRLADYGPRGPVKVPVTSGGDWRNCNRLG